MLSFADFLTGDERSHEVGDFSKKFSHAIELFGRCVRQWQGTLKENPILRPFSETQGMKEALMGSRVEVVIMIALVM